MSHDSDIATKLLWALSLERGTLNVAQLRGHLSGKQPDTSAVLRALQELERKGLISRAMNQRWRVTSDGQRWLKKLAVDAPVKETRPLPSRYERQPAGELPRVEDPGPPPLANPGTRVLDESQQRVITASPGARLVVEAGPGFGKTEVACARVARLVDVGVEPESILLISFTRTAVREMRTRIRQLITSGKEVGGVEVRTLDSFSWRLRAGSGGVSTSRSSRTSYEESIRALLALLEQPSDDIVDFINRFEHVFIDEAQDLTGERAKLVARLLTLVRREAGYTLFLDPAQAIYGWDEDEAAEQATWDFRNLLSALNPAPEHVSLTQLHRTRDPELRQLLLGARRLVLDGAEIARHETLQAALRKRTPGEPLSLEECMEAVKQQEAEDDFFILFRTRAEALNASARLANKPHRLRFGKLPQVIAPWIARVANDIHQQVHRLLVSRAEFERSWAGLGDGWMTRGWTTETAWRALRKLGAVRGQANSLNLAKVADQLAAGQVPDELFMKDIGPGGPIIGTIHGSKGREAETVLMAFHEEVPRNLERALYETRVLYVALSRARERLLVHRLKRQFAHHLQSKRPWTCSSRKKRLRWLRFEVGQEGDVDVSRSMVVLDAEAIRLQQETLASFDGMIRGVLGEANKEDEWRWHLKESFAGATKRLVVLGILSSVVRDEMWGAIHLVEKEGGRYLKPGSELHFVRWYDVTTVAVPRDFKPPVGMPEPWRSTRLWLAPVVSGMGGTPLSERK